MSSMSISGGSSISFSGNTTYITGRDADNDFKLFGQSGNFSLDGKSGTDTLYLDEAASSFSVSGPNDQGLISISNSSKTFTLANFEKIVFSDSSINLVEPAVMPQINGTADNDDLQGSFNGEAIDGGSGRDTLNISDTQRASAALELRSDGQWILNCASTGVDFLRNIERIQFSDKAVALDADLNGHGGQAMAFIGMIAPQLLDNLGTRGQIISLLDQGWDMTELCQTALQINLLPHAANRDLAEVVYQNVIGSTASSDTLDSLTSYIDANGQTGFLSAVASLHYNAHVDLVAIALGGIDYI